MVTQNIKNKKGLNFFKTKYFYIAIILGLIALVFEFMADWVHLFIFISTAIGNIPFLLMWAIIPEISNYHILSKIVHSFLSMIYLLSFFYLLYRIKYKEIKIGLIVLYILVSLLTFIFFFLWAN